MLRVFRISGEELVAASVGKFPRVADLKAFLQDECELHGSRLRLMRDGAVLEDAEKLQSAADLQLVVLPGFVEGTDRQVQNLVYAARSGSVPEVEELLQLPLDPNQRTFVLASREEGCSSYQTPLGAACAGGHAEVVRLLLFAGASKNGRSHQNEYCPEGATPVYLASNSGRPEVVRVLLQASADLQEASGMETLAPLLVATRHNHTEVVQVLLEGAADANKAHGEDTPLGVAILHDHVDVVQLLLENRADTENVVNYDTPLGLAVRKGREEIVSLLLTAGADRNKKFGPVNETPLAVAAKYGYVSILRLLAQARPIVSAAAPKKAKPHGPAHKGSPKKHASRRRG